MPRVRIVERAIATQARRQLERLPPEVQELIEETLASRVGQDLERGLHTEALLWAEPGVVYRLTTLVDEPEPGRGGSGYWLLDIEWSD